MSAQPVQPVVQPAVPPDRRRPLGVLVVVALQFVRAILIVIQLLGLQLAIGTFRLESSFQIPEPAPGTVEFYLSRLVAAFLVLVSVAFGIGLLTGRRWGWVGAIVISGMSLALAIGAWWYGNPAYLAMVINTIGVFYLNQREVRAIFGELQPKDRLAP
jgi:hypothetical protein